MLSSKAKYALRAATVLAEEERPDGWTHSAEIAERAVIPRKFLEAILVELRDYGLVESRRGPAGGHRLTLPSSRITLADVIRAIDGPLALAPCVSQTQFAACRDCVDIESCRLRHVIKRARDAAADVLEGCSLQDLMRSGHARPAFST
jgi:Rrf2 family protein